MSVFNTLQEEPNTVMWNLIIKSYVDSGLSSEALLLYKRMRELDVKVDSFTFPLINRAVLSLKSDLVFGEMVHCVAMKLGFGFDMYFCNTMIEVYTKSGWLSYALKLFEEMSQRDLVSWTSMISGFVFEGNVVGAFGFFNKMRLAMEPNSVTLIVMFQGCCGYEGLIEGRQLHGYVIKNGFLVDGSVQNTISRMYTKFDCLEEVETLFSGIGKRDVVSWNALINFHSLRGDIGKIAGSFNQMQAEVKLNSETLTLITSVLARRGNLMDGEKLHAFSIKFGLCDDILLTSFMNLYAKCGELRNSVQLFREIPCRSDITWNAMMSGFIQNGCYIEAIELFRQMLDSGPKPGFEILGSLVDACMHLGALHLGKGIHGYLMRNLFYIPEEDNMHLGTSILNMYIRCGNISPARECFDRMLVKDIVTWTSMIEGYGIHGLGVEAVKLFDKMLEERIKPNSVTFLSLLSGCSHSGLVSKGCEVFFSMKWRFGIEPELDHYNCMVDLLGRSGRLKEALAIIIKMEVFADNRIWGTLLAASRMHADEKVGNFAAQRAMELEPDDVGYCTLLSNVQASTGKWSEVEELRRDMHEKDVKKAPGWSYIEEKGRNYYFVSGDKSHKKVEEIYEVLGQLGRKVQEFGYV
ncbi:unnamed protein product [Dovyalis caffra]|uniref:Pentatricopeptide repeat-containing protein n=1 Tax=Dovyalis caffra TaxID=77055 RepID=A0AAV1RYV7_9ROSI|nr:unnamed protein product [Dovyalis caffra]